MTEHDDTERGGRMLIVRLSALGDVLHALPAAEALRTARPEAEIGWLVESGGDVFLQGHPALDRLHVFPRKKWMRDGKLEFLRRTRAMLREIAACGYDTALDLQGNFRSGMLSRFSGARRRIGFAGAESRECNALFQTERVAAPADALHVIDKNLALLRAVGIEPPAAGGVPRPRLPALPDPPRLAAWRAAPAPRIVLNPGAGWEAKRWPPEQFGRLAALLHERLPAATIGVSIGPGEEALAEGIRAGARAAGGDPDTLLTAIPPLTMLELAALFAATDLLVTGDTGPLHLAAQLGVPIVAIFAELPPERNGPYPGWGASVVLDRCARDARRPFWRTRRHRPAGGFPIATISPEETLEACLRLLQGRPALRVGEQPT